MKKVLTIAGSDSSGCAGIQRDIRTISALGSHPVCAITAITTQDSRCVLEISETPSPLLDSQLRSGLESGVDAVKIGILPGPNIVALVADALQGTRLPIVLDPVVRSSSGHTFSDSRSRDALKTLLFPLATIVTPNLAEASLLSGIDSEDDAFLETAAQSLLKLGPGAVLVSGGHGPDRATCIDSFFDPAGMTPITGHRVPTSFDRGTGCALSSAIATFLAQGETLLTACRRAGRFVRLCLQQAYRVDGKSGTLGTGSSLEGRS